ncbi:MAG TPA: hypothetical protein VHS06_04030, partial [Chloroflexota bacterium]|nr:hypothetical protein [Chloroflexota bacterium]
SLWDLEEAVILHSAYAGSTVHPTSRTPSSGIFFWYLAPAEVQPTCRTGAWKDMELEMDEKSSTKDPGMPPDREMVSMDLPLLLLVLIVLLSPLLYDMAC